MNSLQYLRIDRVTDEVTILTVNNIDVSGLVDTSPLTAGSMNIDRTNNIGTSNETSLSGPS